MDTHTYFDLIIAQIVALWLAGQRAAVHRHSKSVHAGKNFLSQRMDGFQVLALDRRCTEDFVEQGGAGDAARLHIAALLEKSNVIADLQHLDLDILVGVFCLRGNYGRLKIDQVASVILDDD